MKATCIKYNNTLDNYREKDKSNLFKNLQDRIDQWRQNFNSNCIACADDRCTWIVGGGLEDFVENGFKTLDFYDENFDNRYAFEFLRNDKEHASVIYTLQLLSLYRNDDSSSLLYLAHISNED